jgi:hypothetical protein
MDTRPGFRVREFDEDSELRFKVLSLARESGA